MYILGLNDSLSAAAIIKDGELIAHIREERLNRQKLSDDFPRLAVKKCLEIAGLNSIKKIDHIVFGWNPGHELEPFDNADPVRYHKHFMHYVPNNILNLIEGEPKNKKVNKIYLNFNLWDTDIKLHFLSHHNCHVGSSFLVSPFKEAAILTYDDYGDDISIQMAYGNGNKFEIIKQIKFPHSLGALYSAFTQFLGFKTNSDEWKVMGLSSYGKPEYYDEIMKMVNYDENGNFEIDLSYFSYYIWASRRYTDKFLKVFGPERHPKDKITKRHQNIAASIQKALEDITFTLLKFLYKKINSKNLCIAGGCGMNSVLNGKIQRFSDFTNLFVAPSADDAGCSLGACFYFYNTILNNERKFVMDNDYWGSEYSEEEILKTLDTFKINYKKIDKPEQKAAELLAEGKIIGWYQSRAESGQRALGNRSILADPRSAEMKDKINKYVKFREEFRPFAPSILEEHTGEYFDCDKPVPFMQKVYDVLPEKRDVIPAVTHVDGSGRLQTVSKKVNLKFWNLINEFYKITNVPVVLNTSFNIKGEPIVETPSDAIRCFFGTGMDALFIENYLVVK